MKTKIFCRQDLIILVSALLLAAAALLIYTLSHGGPGASVLITVDGKPYRTCSLYEDTEFTVSGANGGQCTVVIRDGTADFTDATCPDLICVHHRRISRAGECIICLPSRITAQIIGSESGEGLDGVAQ